MVSQVDTLRILTPIPQQMLPGHPVLIQQCFPILTPACMLEVFLDILTPWLFAPHQVLLTSMLLLR